MPNSLATHLSTPDLGIVAFYLIAITLFGLRFAKKGKQEKSRASTLKSYFLADNAIPWWAISLSIVSAETSTLTIISIPGVAFAGNLGFLQIVLGYMLGRIVVAFLFLPKYFRGEMLTAYQLIDRRFGSALHKITAGLFLLTRAAAEGVRVFAISIVVSIAIGTGDTLSIAIISALTLLYTFEGGMAAVIWTDVVQMTLYVAGTIVALFTLGAHIPGGWSHIHAVAAPLGKFQWLDFTLNLTTTYTFWAGILGGTFLTMASHGTDQLMVQRLLAARNLRESRIALLSSGAVIFLQFTLFLLIGVGLFVFYGAGAPHLASEMWVRTTSPDRLFPTYIVQQMPHGIAGLLIAAILAAAMSNLSAALNSLASTTVIDFYLPFKNRANKLRAPFMAESHPDMSGSTSKSQPDTTLISRLSTIFWAITLFLIALYAIQHGGKGHVVETGLSIASVAYGSLLGVFLLGTLTRYANQTGAIIGMITGFALNLTLWQASLASPFFPLRGVPHIAFTWYVLIGAIATFLIGSLFSLIRPNRKAIITVLILALSSSGLAWGFSPTNNGEKENGLQPRVVAPDPTYDLTTVSTLINQAIAEHKLPGAVLLIGHNGHIVFEQAYGLRKLAGEPGLDGKPSAAEPMTLDTIFDMASLTKVIVTTTAILQLYEAGKLDLDTPVSHYLPEFAQPINSVILSGAKDPCISSSQEATRSPACWKSQITIRQLLTHYSGLPEDVSLKDDWGLKSPDKAEGIRRAVASIPYGPPGQTFKYSDINFITLGTLVERLSSETLDVYAQEHIFRPLQLAHSLQTTEFHPFDRACGLPEQIEKIGSAIYLMPRNPEDHRHIDCLAKTAWLPETVIPDTAPTAHDNEGTALTNPDYDHLLRGTVHDPTTRRMGGVAGHAGLFSTAHDMSLFCQAYLDKLLHNTGPFPLKQSTLQLATSLQAPATAVTTATIFTQDGKTTTGVAQRGLGWDINSPFSRPRGEIFPITTKDHAGSFGHTGFTGTSLWLDPTSDTYVILLANAIHPRGATPISPLRSAVATATARALGLSVEAGGFSPPNKVQEESGLQPRLNTAGAARLASEMWASSAARPFSFDQPQPLGAPSIAPLSQAMSGMYDPTPSSPTQPQNPVILSEASRPYRDAQSKDPDAAPLTPTARPFQPQNSPSSSAPKEISTFDFCHLPAICDSFGAHHSPASVSRYPEVSTSGLSSAPKEKGLQPLGYALLPTATTLTGIDVLEQTHFAALKSLTKKKPLNIALLTNQSGLDSHGNRTIDILLHASPDIHLLKIFTPEHGLFLLHDDTNIGHETDPTTNLPVISLYGAKPADRRPKPEDLAGLDAVVVDLQDMGVRFWTYETVLGYFLEATKCSGPGMVVLDRPNPVGGLSVQGNMSSTTNYNSYTAIPVRHGLTYGELARFFEAVIQPTEFVCADSVGPVALQPPGKPMPVHPLPPSHLTVIPMQNWTRSEFFADTHLPFTPPSPNMKTLAATILYPGIGLIDQTNISVGRGTSTPYENIGAPWINAAELTAYLTARKIPGITFTATTLAIAETPEKYLGHGGTIPGVHLTVTDRIALDTPELGIEILSALHHLYPTQFQLEKAAVLVANPTTLAALKSGIDPRDIAATWLPALQKFRTDTTPYLLYK